MVTVDKIKKLNDFNKVSLKHVNVYLAIQDLATGLGIPRPGISKYGSP